MGESYIEVERFDNLKEVRKQAMKIIARKAFQKEGLASVKSLEK